MLVHSHNNKLWNEQSKQDFVVKSAQKIADLGEAGILAYDTAVKT